MQHNSITNFGWIAQFTDSRQNSSKNYRLRVPSFIRLAVVAAFFWGAEATTGVPVDSSRRLGKRSWTYSSSSALTIQVNAMPNRFHAPSKPTAWFAIAFAIALCAMLGTTELFMKSFNLQKVAAKISYLEDLGEAEADAYLNRPRYKEALCFLSAMSDRKGGLEKWAIDFLSKSRGWVSSLPPRVEWDHNYHHPYIRQNPKAWNFPVPNPRWPKGAPPEGPLDPNEFAEIIRTWCTCVYIDTYDDWPFLRFDMRFPGFLKALSDYMDQYAQIELDKTADTKLRRVALYELEFARESGIPMTFVADTREGKTTAIKTYCDAWPGRAVLVTLPGNDSQRRFHEAYAEAFRIPFSYCTPRDSIEWDVIYTLQHTGIQTVHDESHYLIPLNYNSSTPPLRMNWVRREILDRELPTAFFCTPQSEEETLQRYMKKTHYKMVQWWGRMPKPVLLMDSVEFEDLMAVAKKLNPDFRQEVLEELCDAAVERLDYKKSKQNGEAGFKIVVFATKRARYLARQKGLQEVNLPVMREAIEWAGGNSVAPEVIANSKSAKVAQNRPDPSLNRTKEVLCTV